MSPTRSAQAILRPCVGLMFLGAGFGMLLQKIGAPTFLWYSFGAAGLLALVIGVVYLLPFPLPRFADPSAIWSLEWVCAQRRVGPIVRSYHFGFFRDAVR